MGRGAQSQQVRPYHSLTFGLLVQPHTHGVVHTGTPTRSLSWIPEAGASPPTPRSGGVRSRGPPKTCGSTSPLDSLDLGGRTGTGRAERVRHCGTSRCNGGTCRFDRLPVGASDTQNPFSLLLSSAVTPLLSPLSPGYRIQVAPRGQAGDHHSSRD